MTNQEVYNGILKLTDTIEYERLQFAGCTWQHKDEIVHDILFWQPLNAKYKKGRPNKT